MFKIYTVAATLTNLNDFCKNLHKSVIILYEINFCRFHLKLNIESSISQQSCKKFAWIDINFQFMKKFA